MKDVHVKHNNIFHRRKFYRKIFLLLFQLFGNALFLKCYGHIFLRTGLYSLINTSKLFNLKKVKSFITQFVDLIYSRLCKWLDNWWLVRSAYPALFHSVFWIFQIISYVVLFGGGSISRVVLFDYCLVASLGHVPIYRQVVQVFALFLYCRNISLKIVSGADRIGKLSDAERIYRTWKTCMMKEAIF